MRRLAHVLLLTLLLLPAVASCASARSITWSGRTWDVRPGGVGEPGPNHWSDSAENVRVEGSDLVLSIVKDGSGHWTASEVDGRASLGYGTYRWVVKTDLSNLDSHEVLGMFTYSDSVPSHNEIDLEPSHWGNLKWPSGSATVWQDGDEGVKTEKTFSYSARAPYVNQFTWLPGSIRWVVRDAAGATLFDWTVTKGVPTPKDEVPVINYWRFNGQAPGAARSMRLSSFEFLAPGLDPSAPVPSPGSGATVIEPPGPAGDVRGGARPDVVLKMRRRRLAGDRRALVLRWRSTGTANLQLAVQRLRRNGEWKRLGVLRRTVTAGRGRVRVRREIGGRRLPAGRYRLLVRASGADVAISPRKLHFQIG